MENEAWIIDAVRSPRGKGKKTGSLHEVHPQRILAQVLNGAARLATASTRPTSTTWSWAAAPAGRRPFAMDIARMADARRRMGSRRARRDPRTASVARASRRSTSPRPWASGPASRISSSPAASSRCRGRRPHARRRLHREQRSPEASSYDDGAPGHLRRPDRHRRGLHPRRVRRASPSRASAARQRRPSTGGPLRAGARWSRSAKDDGSLALDRDEHPRPGSTSLESIWASSRPQLRRTWGGTCREGRRRAPSTRSRARPIPDVRARSTARPPRGQLLRRRRRRLGGAAWRRPTTRSAHGMKPRARVVMTAVGGHRARDHADGAGAGREAVRREEPAWASTTSTSSR